MDKALGLDTQTIVIAGQKIELKPMTLGMLAALTAFCRRKPVVDYIEMTRGLDIDKASIAEQITSITKAQSAKTDDQLMQENAQSHDTIVMLFSLRSGLGIDEIRALPIAEIVAYADLISDYGDAEPEMKTVLTESPGVKKN